MDFLRRKSFPRVLSLCLDVVQLNLGKRFDASGHLVVWPTQAALSEENHWERKLWSDTGTSVLF
jgi:hypothetical protein